MEQKFIDYVEKYFELKYEYKLLDDKVERLKAEHEALIYHTVRRQLSYSDSLSSWEYNDLAKGGISKEKADEIVKLILEERKAEKEAEDDEN